MMQIQIDIQGKEGSVGVGIRTMFGPKYTTNERTLALHISNLVGNILSQDADAVLKAPTGDAVPQDPENEEIEEPEEPRLDTEGLY